MTESEPVRVASLHSVDDREWVVAQLAGTTWPSSWSGLVCLSWPSGSIRMHCVGYGEAGGAPMLALTPLDPAVESVRDIVARLGGETPAGLFVECDGPVTAAGDTVVLNASGGVATRSAGG